MIKLSDQKTIAKGGKRDVYAHPKRADRCIKVWIRGRDPVSLRNAQPWTRRLRKRTTSFDENKNDFDALSDLESYNPPSVWTHVPRCFGWVETDRGKGLVVEKILDYDGTLSRSFKTCLQNDGYLDAYKKAVDEFCDFWRNHQIPCRNMIVDNLTMQKFSQTQFKLYIVDGFGSRQFIPLDRIWRGSSSRQEKKILALKDTIDRQVKRLNR